MTDATSDATTVDLRYPIGKFTIPASPLPRAERDRGIETIAALPAELRRAVAGLDARQLETPYRPGGWTVRQLVHHVADSHVNGYVRTKLALTEERPTIKPYEESLWATLADVPDVPIEVSLTLLEALHVRWAALFRSMTDADFARAYHHPEQRRDVRLDEQVANYAWHSRHHTAHVARLREREGW